MATINMRAHEFGPTKPRIRVWDDNAASCGQFNVVQYDDIQEFVNIGMRIGVGRFIVHRCDGTQECSCRPMTFGEQISDYC